jgi:hypothetical protein
MILRTNNKYFLNTIRVYRLVSEMEKHCVCLQIETWGVIYTTLYANYRLKIGKQLFKIPFLSKAIIIVEVIKLTLLFYIL